MTAQVLFLLGGIGLFLFGMQTLTEGLRSLASAQIRGVLARFTVSPLTGAMTGALTTAAIQSSSATMVTVIGFVGAGLMTFPQAIGVIYGANIGTTITGWIVALIGIKLKLATAALPLLLAGSLIRLSGNARVSAIGRALAGFSLIFLGLDTMQDGAAVFSDLLTPESFPADTWGGRFRLMLLGMVITIVIQSSSAGVAMTLVLLSTGTIGLAQGASMVIGMDVGTTATALLATLGGSRDMRRTAIAHVAYNIVTGVVAFALLGLIVPLLLHVFGPNDPAALVAFHTLFNLFGVVLMLPFTTPFARMIARLVPGAGAALTDSLDRRLLNDAGAAMLAAHVAAGAIARRIFAALGAALEPVPDYRAISALQPTAGSAIDELESFLGGIRPEPGDAEDMAIYSALLHQIDHLRRLLARSESRPEIAVSMEDRTLRRPALAFGAILRRAATDAGTGFDTVRLRRLETILESRAKRHRRGLLLGEHAGLISLDQVFDRTDAERWLQHAAHHAERIAYYDAVARPGVTPPPA